MIEFVSVPITLDAAAGEESPEPLRVWLYLGTRLRQCPAVKRSLSSVAHLT